MSLPLFYAENISLFDSCISFDEANSRHIVQVLRMDIGEHLMVTDGKGKLLTVELDQVNKKGAGAKVLSALDIPAPLVKTCIAISLVKNASRFEWFLEKSAELGISEIIPLICERTERQHFRLDRMKTILVSAMLQSQQAWLPKLHEPLPFSAAIQVSDYPQKCVAHCQEGKEAINISRLNSTDNTIILIGPEGDFTKGEITSAISAGYVETKLGETRLRTETAGIVAATFLKVK